MNIPIEVRNTNVVPCVKARMILVDPRNKSLVPFKDRNRLAVISPSGPWRSIDPEESEIELVVIRNVSKNPELLASMNTVVEKATGMRRSVRPTHPGELTQMGYNAGPRHCRVFGLVNNFKSPNLALEKKCELDERAVGALSFMWHLIRARAPKEVVDSVQTAIEQSGMPEMDSRFSKEKAGYSITVGKHEFTFPTVRKAPCEGYFATNYAAPTHSDMAFADYAFSWSTKHSTPPLRPGQNPGGNFTDVSLRVVVQSAADTLIIFRPMHRHGTTLARGTTSRAGMVIAFSIHIKKAYEVALANALKGNSARLISAKKRKRK